MNRKPVLTLAALALAALVTWPLVAQPTGGDFAKLRPRLLARALDLSEAQSARSRELFRQTIEQTKPLRDEMRTLRTALRRELDRAEPADATIGRLARDLHGLRSQLAAERKGLIEGFEALLTPQQKERFEILRDLRRKVRENRRGDHSPSEDSGS